MKTKADEEKSRSRFQGWGKKFDLQGNEKVFISAPSPRIDFLCADNITTTFNGYAVSVKVGESAL